MNFIQTDQGYMFTTSAINRRSYFFTASVAVLTGLLIWGNGLFFFDEDIFITNLQSAFMQQDWQRAWMVKQLLKAAYFFFGTNPAGYHITSAVLHVVCGILAAVLFKKLLKNCGSCFTPQKEQAAVLVFYLLFLFTPVHSEPLCYILAQGVLVFTLFSILTVLFFIKAVTGNRWFLLLSLLFFCAALLCYEISWMIPFINFSLVLFLRKKESRLSFKAGLFAAALYFIVLGIWFYIKTVFISRSLVADYGGITLANIDLIAVARNSIVLFLRNYIPPVKSTVYFVLLSAFAICVIAAAVRRVLKKQRTFRSIVLLLIVLTVMAFLPTSLLGIDSHDSESERYIYFSSVFALMLLAALLTAAINNRITLQLATGTILLLYAAIFFQTVHNYKQAGQFSKKYLAAVNQYTNGVKTVYTVNQPAQFKGALMLRALTRMPGREGDNYTVLNEYMNYLYKNSSTGYITFSAEELNTVPAKLSVVVFPLDSCAGRFPEAAGLKTKPGYKKNEAAVAVLRNDSLWIYR